MGTIAFRITGPAAEAAAGELETILGQDVACFTATRSTPPPSTGADHKAIDPVALGALILSIPSAVLAVVDITERIRKRKKAQQAIDCAKQHSIQNTVNIFVVTPSGPLPLKDLTADRLLELTAETSRR